MNMVPDPGHPPDAGAAAAARPKRRFFVAAKPRSHRGDTVSAGEVGNILLRFAVVLLSSINAVLWEVYTQAPFMALLWALIAISFAIWMVREVRNR